MVNKFLGRQKADCLQTKSGPCPDKNRTTMKKISFRMNSPFNSGSQMFYRLFKIDFITKLKSQTQPSLGFLYAF